MSNLSPLAVFISAAVAGLFFGIYWTTGVNIDPEDLAMDVTGKAVQAIGTPQATTTWSIFDSAWGIGSLIAAIINLALIYSMGWKGIVPAIFGFFGMFFIITNFVAGVGMGMLFVGGAIAKIMS